MQNPFKRHSCWLLTAARLLLSSSLNICLATPSVVTTATDAGAARVTQVTASAGSGGIEVEIATTLGVVPHSQVVTGPDRLILDFPDTVPGSNLYNQAVNRGPVKGIRVGLFSQHPPVTRVVVDLKSAQAYRIYASGKTVIVKFRSNPGEGQTAAGAEGKPRDSSGAELNDVSYAPVPVKPATSLEVDYSNNRLSILAHNVSLAQVLNEIQRKTGTDIPIPSMAAQEQVVANIGPLPIRESLAALLNGSRFNFILVGSDTDPAKLKSVILSFRSGGESQPAIATPSPEPAVVEAQPEPATAQPDIQPPQDGAAPAESPQPQEAPPQ